MKRHCCQASPKYSLQIGSIFRSDAKGHRAPIWRATALKFCRLGGLITSVMCVRRPHCSIALRPTPHILTARPRLSKHRRNISRIFRALNRSLRALTDLEKGLLVSLIVPHRAFQDLRKSRRPFVQRPSIRSPPTIRPHHGRVTSGAVRLMYFPTSFPPASTLASISPRRLPSAQSKSR